MARVEHFDGATLYLGDCREIVPGLPRHDALIGDPPYGQRQKTNVDCGPRSVQPDGTSLRRGAGRYRGGVTPLWPAAIIGDDGPFDPAPWLAAADVVLLWGAHKFADRLPPGQFLIWDKVPTGKVRSFGDGEAAWLNAARPLRIFRLLWDGLCVGFAARHEVTAGTKRVHPMQKPVVLMAWCIVQARLAPGASIVDPWMGAGSTGIAAVQAGHPFTGVEILPAFFETACRRLEAATRARDLKAA
jgi:site-specific DNA-methyltransferase (adenine-specific)/modification methylase